MKKPSKAQVVALAWAIYRAGGFMRSIEFGYLDFRDATVAALEAAGWADQVSFYTGKWRWQWFHVTPAGAALPEVVAEGARLRAAEIARNTRAAADDGEAAS